ncbi:MAG: SlyX family protein [Alphaproteobacteria bacterium]
MEQRLVDIEITLANQERQIAEMSEVITDQWRLIESLRAQLKCLDQKMQLTAREQEQSDPLLGTIEKLRQEKPPHY